MGLRQHTAKGHRRDELVELLERELLAPLDAAGASVLGASLDPDDPDRFVRLRGFESPRRRVEALEHRTGDAGPVTATVCSLGDVGPEVFGTFFDAAPAPLPAGTSSRSLGTFTTAGFANGFPRLPAREGEPVLVSFDEWRHGRFEVGRVPDLALEPLRTRQGRCCSTCARWSATSEGAERNG